MRSKNKMSKNLNMLIRAVWVLMDLIILLLAIPSACVLFIYRRIGSKRLKITTETLKRIGIFPIINHYNEPLFKDSLLRLSLDQNRKLPGIDFRRDEQLAFLKSLNYDEEFKSFIRIQSQSKGAESFQIDNGSFESGDADFLFQFLRNIKPKKVIEIGSGSSTKIARHALELNESQSNIPSRHICIEPYLQPWLDSFEKIELIRSRVEDCKIDFANELDAGDFLFIDSSHIIRPQGDILSEYLDIIPQLRTGVYVHVHDVFTPKDYPDEIIRENILFWNEQYLLEATLGNKARYEVIAALSLLKSEFYNDLKRVCPFLTPDRNPGSFYFRIK